MKQATIIIDLHGKDDEAINDALIEVVKNIVNENGACGTGRNGEGASFEFSTLHSDIKNRRGAFERILRMQESMLELAKRLIDEKRVATPDEEKANEAQDQKEMARINAASGDALKGAPDDALAELAAAVLCEVANRAAKAASQPEGQQKPEGGTLH